MSSTQEGRLGKKSLVDRREMAWWLGKRGYLPCIREIILLKTEVCNYET